MSKKSFTLKSETDTERLENMTDEDIDFSDIPPLTEEDFKRMRPLKEVLAERGIEYNPKGPHTVTIHHEDGTTTTHEYNPQDEPPNNEPLLVKIEPDIRKYFPDSESVNRTLRSLIALIPERDKQP